MHSSCTALCLKSLKQSSKFLKFNFVNIDIDNEKKKIYKNFITTELIINYLHAYYKLPGW